MNNREGLERLIILKDRRLQILREQEAILGIRVDPSILIEIEELQAQIAELRNELAADSDDDQINSAVLPADQANQLVFELQRFLNGEGFTPFPLDEQLITLETFGLPEAPSGIIVLGGIPFEITTSESGAMMVMVRPSLDNQAQEVDLNIRCTSALSLFILVSSEYALKSWQGANPDEGWDEKVIGQIILTFGDGTTQIQELRLGHHLRDTSVGNQPWAVDRIRSPQAREVWMSSSMHVALDMLRIDVEDGPKHLESVRAIAQLEVEQVRRVSQTIHETGEVLDPRLPSVKILGITCWSAEES